MNLRILLLSTTLGLSFAISNAQELDRREKIEIGAKIGLNVSNVWDSKGQEFKANQRIGFAGGVFLGIPIGKFIGIQPEVLFSQKGFNASGSILGASYSTERTTTFLDIPLQVQLKPVEFITILAGPQFSYLLNQKDKYTFAGNSVTQEQEFNNDNVRKNIMGFVVGADLFYKNALLSARLGWDVMDNHGNGSSSTPRYKNQWLQFTVGFKI